MQILQLAIGAGTAAIFAGSARKLRLLSPSGAVAAAAVGIVVFGLGGWAGAIPLLVFFLSSNLLGRWRRREKARLGFEKGGERDAAQVLANGGLATAALLVGTLIPTHHHALYIVFAASVAAANSDTWATEIGAGFGTRPFLITTLKRVSRGRSGGVTIQGGLAAVAGAALIAATASPWLGPHALNAALVVTVAGFVGAVADSILGATVQAQFTLPDGTVTETAATGATKLSGVSWMRNDAVNFTATVVAGAVAASLAR